MVGKSHFQRLSKHMCRLREDGFLTDCTITTKQGHVDLHKIVLFAFSAYHRECFKNAKESVDETWNINANEFEKAEVDDLVMFLYNGDKVLGEKITEMIKSLNLDLSINSDKIRRKLKKMPAGQLEKESVELQHFIHLELQYLRNLTFEMEIPKYLQYCEHADITIKTGATLHKCHRVILSACSKYFEVMFACGMIEAKEDVIDLQGVKREVFSLVLNFMYTGNFSATVGNAQDLLSTSVYLQAEELQALCEDFLLGQIDTDNCVDMWLLGKSYNCSFLTEGSWNYLVDHFYKISKRKLVQGLKQEDLKLLLGNDQLTTADETEVLTCVLQWVSCHKQPEALEDLIEIVPLGSISLCHLRDIIANNPDVRQSKKALELLQKELSGSERLGKSIRKGKAFVVIKRSSYSGGIEVAAYSLPNKTWHRLKSFTHTAGGTGFSACVSESAIHVTGGTATPTAYYKFSVVDNTWSDLPEMLQGRSSHSSGYVNGSVYVLGGSDVSAGAFSILSTIERYDPETKNWTKVGNMEILTYDSAHAVVKSKIYIFGGSMGITSGVYIKDIQCFDTETNTAMILYHNLPFTLSLASACSHNSHIYITCPNGKLLHYNEEEMPTVVNDNKGLQLMGFASLYHEQAVYIMGGYNMTGESESVYRVDLRRPREHSQTTNIKLPFKKQSNQLFAAVMHVSREYLIEEMDTLQKRKPNTKQQSKSPRYQTIRL